MRDLGSRTLAGILKETATTHPDQFARKLAVEQLRMLTAGNKTGFVAQLSKLVSGIVNLFS